MKKTENDCVDCGRPEYCSCCTLNEYTEHYYCDICGCPLDEDSHYIANGQDYCENCLLEEHKRRC
jgi:hypothetical protein